MAADAIEEYGLELSALNDETIQELDDILPAHWSRGNPVDILGDAGPERYKKAAECCFHAEAIDGMLIIVNPQAMTNPSHVAETLGDALKDRPYPVFTALMGGHWRVRLPDRRIRTGGLPDRPHIPRDGRRARGDGFISDPGLCQTLARVQYEGWRLAHAE